jgi:uncharacterized membrane protein
MEALLFLCCAALFVLLWRTNSRLKRDREEDREKWLRHSSRISALEQTISAMRAAASDAKRSGSAEDPESGQIRNVPWADTGQAAEAPASNAFPQSFDHAAETIASEDLPEAVTPPISSGPPEAPLPASAKPVLPLSAIPPVEAAPAPKFAHVSLNSAPAAGGRSWHDVEEILGTNWLNKVGVALLVLGVAFFLALQLKTLGPPGKVLVGL